MNFFRKKPLSWQVPEGTEEAHCVCRRCGTHFHGAVAQCPDCGSRRARVVRPPDRWLEKLLSKLSR